MTTARTADRIGVFIGSAAGVRPSSADYYPDLHALRWSVVAGSDLWSAVFVSDLGAQVRRIKDYEIVGSGNRQVEIWRMNSDLEQERILFWGELLGSEIRIEENGEQEVVYASIQPYHFGQTVNGQVVYYADEEYTIPIPLEFQPMIDGKICDNRWKPDARTSGDEYYWIDPESIRTDTAKEFQEGELSEWTLTTAVESLMLHFNAIETFIANSPHDTLHADIIESEAQQIKNIVLQFGEYLPAYLDALCNRNGYGWCVDIKSINDTANTHYAESFPTLRFFKQQSGDEKTVKMQAPGAVLDVSLSNTVAANVTANLANIRNVIRGCGALIEREFTIPLYRTWEDTDDANYDNEKPHIHIGRKWAANEAGDYNGLRAEIPDDPPNFGDNWIPKRRVAEDCLTLRQSKTGEGQRRPAYLEYREDSESSWKAVPNEWGYRLLHDEVGVWFTGQREEGGTEGGIPDAMLTADVELRLTCTLRGDKRLEFTSANTGYSPNSNDIAETLDLSDRFFDRQRQADGDYASTLTGEADEKDDTDALTDYVNKIARLSDLSDVQATITLFGLHYCFDANGDDDAYKIGDIITKIEGREISFNRASAGFDNKYLQVVGITWNNEIGNQTTTISLSPTGVS